MGRSGDGVVVELLGVRWNKADKVSSIGEVPEDGMIRATIVIRLPMKLLTVDFYFQSRSEYYKYRDARGEEYMRIGPT